jgi:hypothetical protein
VKQLIRTGLITLLLLGSLQAMLAQDTTTTTQETSNITIFFVACETEAVINLSGLVEPGFDVYYQVFAGAGASGQALSGVRRLGVSGSFTFSERVPYADGFQLGAGATGSVRVNVARTTDPSRVIITDTVNDVQDGCASPQNPLGTSEDLGGEGVGAPTTPRGGILSPFGGVINANFLSATPVPPVVIGAPPGLGRSDTPGVIFAECNMYRDRAEPGVLYDTDDITIFWSWYARTPAQVQQHIDSARYNVRFNTAPLEYVELSPIEQRTANYWVFYYARIGRLTPGQYGIEFHLTWEEAISDGFEQFGPGTENDEIYSNCSFEILPNPDGVRVDNYNLMYSRPR